MPKLMVRIQALKAPVLESFLEVAASPTYPHAQKDIHVFKALTAAMGIKVSQEHCIETTSQLQKMQRTKPWCVYM